MMSESEIAGSIARFGISRAEAVTIDYIGDGVYATFDGYQTWVQTLEGQRIALEPPVLARLVGYNNRMVEAVSEKPE